MVEDNIYHRNSYTNLSKNILYQENVKSNSPIRSNNFDGTPASFSKKMFKQDISEDQEGVVEACFCDSDLCNENYSQTKSRSDLGSLGNQIFDDTEVGVVNTNEIEQSSKSGEESLLLVSFSFNNFN